MNYKLDHKAEIIVVYYKHFTNKLTEARIHHALWK